MVGSTPYAESFDLIADDDNLSRATVEGWVQRATAEMLFELAGLDFEAAKQQAADRAFEPIPLGVTGSIEIRNELRTIDSQNVLARIPGTEAPDEVVMYVAHWDHMGTDESLEGDQVYNGAADNATGTQGLIEIARAFMEGEPPRRSVLFLAVTAEEQGLLGSRYYGEEPLYPAAQTVAAVNMDVLNQWGRTRDLTIVGMGQSGLDDVAADVAAELGRVLNPDPEPEKGFYYRSDHFSFAAGRHPRFLRRPGRRLHRQAGGLRHREAERVHRQRLPRGLRRGEARLGPLRRPRGPDVHVSHGRPARRHRRVARLERHQRVPGHPRGAASGGVGGARSSARSLRRRTVQTPGRVGWAPSGAEGDDGRASGYPSRSPRGRPVRRACLAAPHDAVRGTYSMRLRIGFVVALAASRGWPTASLQRSARRLGRQPAPPVSAG